MSRPVPSVHVRVPASSANLGSGFDTLALAIGLYDDLEVTATSSGLEVVIEGEGAGEVPTDDRHLVVRAIRAAGEHLGVTQPGLRLCCTNRIPHSRGLGSSAAAAVAGVLAGYALAGAEPDGDVLELAAGFEGHADNAAASLHGGFVIAWRDGDRYEAARLEPHHDLSPVLLVPSVTSSTEATRGLLPAEIPHPDGAFAASRAALAVHAFTSAPEFLLAATDDRLHQPYRRPAYPETAALVEALRAAGIPAAVSGAGPTVLALPRNAELPADVDTSGFTVNRWTTDRGGAVVETT